MELSIQEVNTLILGGGITGLSLASFLQEKDYLVLEKEKELGGYCKTTIQGDFIWDYSGHFFHFNNQEIKDYLVEDIECEILQLNKITNIYYKGQLLDFPFQYNIDQLSLEEFIECLYDYYNKKDSTGTNFKSFIRSELGNAICDKFIIPYNEKLYACDLDTLDFDCMGRFFPKSLQYSELLEKLKNKSKIPSYNDSFIYPVNGSFEFVKSLLKKVKKENIKVNSEVLKVDLSNKLAYVKDKVYKFTTLVNTLPFSTFLKLNNSPYTLRSNKVAVFNLGFDKETTIKSHWIYYPGDELFYRVGFYNNILAQKKMSLYVEVSLKGSSSINEKDLLESVLKDLKKVGVITGQVLIDYQMLIMDPAYVHITKDSKEQYDNWSDNNNKNSIYSIGRYGSWTYCSIEDNIIQAKQLANRLLVL
jgi:protoporphyrinogen oxidase